MSQCSRLSVPLSVAVLSFLGCVSPSEPDPPFYGRAVPALSPANGPTEATLRATADLASCLAYGQAHRAELLVAHDEWRAAEERIEQAGTLPEPRLSYGEFLEEVQTRTGSQERRIGLSQAFPWPGQLRGQTRVAERRAAAGERHLADLRQRVAAEIETAFHDYALLSREQQITGELLSLLRGLEPVVQGRVRAGGKQEDVLRLQVEIGRLEDEQASLVRQRAARSSKLAEAMGYVPAPGELLPLPTLDVPDLEAVDVEESHRQAEENNPSLGELAERAQASREAEVLARLRRRPTFALGVDYIATDGSAVSNVARRGNDPVIVGLSLTLPIWGASYAAAEREARLHTRAARERVELGRSRIRSQVEAEAFVVDDAARRIAFLRDSLIPRASETLELTLGSYRTGAATILDLIDAERVLLEFQLSVWRAGADYLKGAARLRALKGEVSQ